MSRLCRRAVQVIPRIVPQRLVFGQSTSFRLNAFAALPQLPSQTAQSRRWLQMSSSETASEAEAPKYTVTEVGYDKPKRQQKRRPWPRGYYHKKNIKGSTKKLMYLAKQIRGMSLPEAVAQMTFNLKWRSDTVRRALYSAMRNAMRWNRGIKDDDLMVEHAVTMRSQQQYRLRYHSRGRSGKGYFRTSSLRIVLRKMREEEKEKLLKFKKDAKVGQGLAKDPRWY